MTTALEESLTAELARWESAGRRRHLPDEDGVAPRADFVSNDYLGLAGHPEVVAAARDAVQEFGAGGRAARLLGGGSPLAARAERAAAHWLGSDAALLFPTGYQANLGVVGALAGRGDTVFSDELNHASLIDAARLSRARVHVYAHGDLDELDALLARSGTTGRRLIVTESVFSMDGDLARLAELNELAERRDAWLVVDEAHAAGVLGPGGAGAWAAVDLPHDRLAARIATGGKALGVAGAFAVGTAALRDQLLNRARAFVFTTAPPPAVSGALVRAVELAREMDDQRARCVENARALAHRLGLPAPDAAIVPFLVGADRDAVALADRVAAAGLDVRAVRPPTVPEGTARLRIACHAFNTEAELGRLTDELAHAAPSASEVRDARNATPLFVVGTDTGIGKTVVSALLLRAARELGTASYWKPVQTGDDSDTHEVARLAPRATAGATASAFRSRSTWPTR